MVKIGSYLMSEFDVSFPTLLMVMRESCNVEIVFLEKFKTEKGGGL